MTPPPEVVEASLAARKLKKLPHNLFHQRGLDQGICRGICLDWLRRALMGGTPWYGYERRGNPKGERREQIMTAAQQTFEGRAAAVANEADAKLHSLLQARQTALGQQLAAVNKLTGKAFDTAATEYKAASAKLDAQVVQFNALANVATMKKGWTLLARELDASLAEAKGKPIDRVKRKFGDLRVTEAGNPGDFGDHAAVARAAAGVVERLEASRGVMLLWSAGPKSIGHTVAVMRSAKESFVLFDPNYGMFYGRADAAADGVAYLANEVYPYARTFQYEILARTG